MIQSKRDLSRRQVERQDIEAADSFTYLETESTRESEEEVQIQKRTMSANKVYFTHHKITTST
jgi:hypothetical protein